MTITRDIHRRFHSMPPGMPESITAKFAEATALAERLRSALTLLNDLAGEHHDEAAHEADRKAAAAMMRATGKPARSAGAPATTQLAEDRKAAEAEVDVIISAVAMIEDEIAGEFGKLQANAKASGVADAEAALGKYGKAAEALLTARDAFHTAASRAGFLHLAAPSEWLPLVDGMPTPMPRWLDEVTRRMNRGHQLHWNPATPNINVNTISRSGERDYDMNSVTAATSSPRRSATRSTPRRRTDHDIRRPRRAHGSRARSDHTRGRKASAR
jgi:hypothetical protein